MSKNFILIKTKFFLIVLILILTIPTHAVFSLAQTISNKDELPIKSYAGILTQNLSQSNSDLSGLIYNEQIGETFSQTFTSMTYNVTAIAQVNSDNLGPAYLLNGLSDKGYWYQVGLSYNWPAYYPGIAGFHPKTGFFLNYEVFDPTGKVVFPPDGGGGIQSFQGTVNVGDIVRLNLFMGKGSNSGEVVMLADDLTTSASAFVKYSSESATYFVGNSDTTSNSQGYFTGLMTEQYSTKPNYANGQFVKYSCNSLALTSAILWINERNLDTNQNIFSKRSDSSVTFDNYYQIHELETNGVTEYADAHEFFTGADPLSMTLSATSIKADSGMQVQTTITVSASGGTAPYNYAVYLDNKLISNSSSSNNPYSTTILVGHPLVGLHQYYVNVHDSKFYPASSQTVTFTVNPTPTLTISSQPSADTGQVIPINYKPSQGTPPYTTTLYLNGVALTQTDQNSVMMTKIGSNQLYAELTDAAGITVSSNTLLIRVIPDLVASVTPINSVTDVGLPITFTESVVNGTAPYFTSWILNDQPVTGSTDANYKFSSNSSGIFSISAQITDGNGFVVKSSPLVITVNTLPVLSSYSSTGQSTNFFFTNNAAQSRVNVSGGTAPHSYNWYLNGLKVAQTNESKYVYTLSNIGHNLLQVKVSDAVGYSLASETTTIDYGLDFLHIGVVVAIVFIALILFNSRRGKDRVSETIQRAREVRPLGQDEHETLETLFKNVDLSIAEQQLIGCYHTTGPGRKQRKPLGILRALIVMRMKSIRSLRELTRILDVDRRVRRLCLITRKERGYTRSVINRFTRHVGAETLQLIIEEKVIWLLRRSRAVDVDVLLDASLIKARSIRHTDDSRAGFSDADAMVGRNGRFYSASDSSSTSP
jgi:hypothetical protein